MLLFMLGDRLHKTVAELERELTPEELIEWVAYFTKIMPENK